MATQDELKQEIAESHEHFFACCAGFDETVLETQPVSGVWSARDVAGHLADWHNEILDAVEHVLSGSPSKIRLIRDIDAYNADRAALRGIETWERSAADLRSACERANHTLDRLSDDDLARIGTLPWGPVERIQIFFQRISSHTLTHADEAESWRWRMLGVLERHEEP